MPDLPLLILTFGLVTACATVQGATGFGFNILVVPLLVLFIDPKVVVPTIILQNVLLDCAVLVASWRFANPCRIWVLVLAGIAGTPVGVVLLRFVDPDPLRVVIGLAVMLSGAAMLLGVRRTLKSEHLASAIAGFAGGSMNGLVGMAGPPVILLMANQAVEPREFRANIVTYFTVITFFAAASLWAGGQFTHDVMVLSLAIIPGTTLGVLAGIRLHSRVPIELFLRVSLALVILAGASAFVVGLLTL